MTAETEDAVLHRQRGKAPRMLYLGFSAFGLFGLLIAAIGMSYLVDAVILASQGETAEGRVVSVVTSRDREGRSTSSPLIRFTTARGEVIEFTPSVGDSALLIRGLEVTVRYDPENPGRAEVDSQEQLWGAPLYILLFALPFLAIGGGFWLRVWGRKRALGRLHKLGRRVEARLLAVDRQTTAAFSRDWVIRAEWRDPKDGRRHIYLSRSLPFDPQRYLKGEHIGLLLDPENPDEFWMDLSELPSIEA